MISDMLESVIGIISKLWSWWLKVSDKNNEIRWEILTASIMILSVIWSIWAFGKSRKGMANSLPPGPRGLPIVGYLPFLGTNLHEIFTKLAQRHGPIFKLWLGNKLCVVVNSPSVAKEMLRDQDVQFANRGPTIASLIVTYGGLDIACSSYGPYWRDMRKVLVRGLLGNTNLEACYNLRREEVRHTIADLYSKIGTSVNISEVTFLTEFNIIMNILWGSTFGREKTRRIGAEFKDVVSKIMEIVGKPNISDVFPILARFDIQGVEKQSRILLQETDRILDIFIDAGKKTEKEKIAGRKDFMHILLELKESNDTATPINMTQIKAILMDIVVGGTDTTATTVEWVMAELLRHPRVLKKVQEELTNCVGMNNIVEESHLPKLHYLEAVVKETFRLHPAVPVLVRYPSQSCTVSNYTIPKDTIILLNVWAIHMDPRVWDNPSEFKPERFSNDPSQWDYTGNNLQFLPFGSGRRICAGIPLGEKMVMYVLASLLHSFDWHLKEGEELDLGGNSGISIRKKTSLMATPSQRLSDVRLYA